MEGFDAFMQSQALVVLCKQLEDKAEQDRMDKAQLKVRELNAMRLSGSTLTNIIPVPSSVDDEEQSPVDAHGRALSLIISREHVTTLSLEDLQLWLKFYELPSYGILKQDRTTLGLFLTTAPGYPMGAPYDWAGMGQYDTVTRKRRREGA